MAARSRNYGRTFFAAAVVAAIKFQGHSSSGVDYNICEFDIIALCTMLGASTVRLVGHLPTKRVVFLVFAGL